MKKVNLITLWKLNKGSRTPFLGSSEFLAQFPFMEEYLREYRRIDRDFITQKGFLSPVWNTQYENTNNGILAQFKEDFEDLIFRNKNTYQRLYDLTKQKYNPIENYDRMEHADDTTIDTNTRTSDYGEGMEHFDYGEKITSNNYGARSQTDIHGAQIETMEHGAQSQSTEYGAQKQSTVYGAQSQSTEYGAQSQSTEYGAQTVTNDFGEHNTNISHGAQSQSMSHGGHTDIHSIGAQSNSSSHRISGFNDGLADDSSDTNNIGSRQDSDTIGSYTDINSSQAYIDSTKDGAHTDTVSHRSHTDTTSNAEHIDTTSNDEHTDTVSKTAYTDTTSLTAYTNKNINDEYVDTSAQKAYQDLVNESAKSDVHTTEAKKDIHKDDGKTVYKHEARIHGNIGVTTTAQMIEGERQLWTKFNFYKTIYDDIAKDLCMYVDEGIDAFYAGLNEEDEDDMTIGNDKIRATVEQTPNGARITITDSEGTTSAEVTNGANGKDGVTPKFKVERDGDIYVDYSGEQEA